MKRKVKIQPELVDYPPEFLACRVDRHRWNREADWERMSAYVSERIRRCEVCRTETVQAINTANWERVGSVRYRYAPGYAQRGKGLVADDYRTAHLSGDFARAGRVGR